MKVWSLINDKKGAHWNKNKKLKESKNLSLKLLEGICDTVVRIDPRWHQNSQSLIDTILLQLVKH